MIACLSTNGPNLHAGPKPPTRLLVATTHGVNILARKEPGARWEAGGRALEGKHVSATMIAPRDGGIFAGIHNEGVFHSADGGTTWRPRDKGITVRHVYSLGCREHADGVTLYAGTEPVSLFRSGDNGVNWEELPAIADVPGHEKWTFPPPPHIAHTKAFLFDPRDSDVFYATVEQGALLKTTDGGRTWRELASYYRPDDVWYKDIHRIVSRPGFPDELYMATGIGLYRSADAGETWERLTDMQFRIGYPDQLVFSPDGATLFMSGARHDPTDWRTSHQAHGTVLRSRDHGRSWEDANEGLPTNGRANIEAFNVAVYPGGFTMFAGNTDGEVFTSEDGGGTWSLIASGLGPVSKGGHFRNLQKLPA